MDGGMARVVVCLPRWLEQDGEVKWARWVPGERRPGSAQTHEQYGLTYAWVGVSELLKRKPWFMTNPP